MKHNHYQRRRMMPVPVDFRECDENGYYWVCDTNTFSPTHGLAMPEHIVVAERQLGRPLYRGAEVHHKDQNPANNDPTNLQVCKNAEEHREIHRALKRVKKAKMLGSPNRLNWEKCKHCNRWGPPWDMVRLSDGFKHVYCKARKGQKVKTLCEMPNFFETRKEISTR